MVACHHLFQVRDSLLTSSLFTLWSSVLTSGLGFRTSRLACDFHRACPSATSYSLWLEIWAPLDFPGCSRVIEEGWWQFQTSLAFHPNREKQLIQWQASEFLLQEPSPQVCLTWDLEAVIFYSASMSRALNLWSTWPGENYLTSQNLCFFICK